MMLILLFFVKIGQEMTNGDILDVKQAIAGYKDIVFTKSPTWIFSKGLA